jgi:hypothetical protein
MNKRLVELDKDTMYAKEFDVVRLKREAAELKTFLTTLTPEDDQANLRARVLPFCEAALNGSLKAPLHPRQKPINIMRMIDEGISLPEGFELLYARFFNTALGAQVDVENVVHKDGKPWGWMEFEGKTGVGVE